jgi:hypothetical protein
MKETLALTLADSAASSRWDLNGHDAGIDVAKV